MFDPLTRRQRRAALEVAIDLASRVLEGSGDCVVVPFWSALDWVEPTSYPLFPVPKFIAGGSHARAKLDGFSTTRAVEACPGFKEIGECHACLNPATAVRPHWRQIRRRLLDQPSYAVGKRAQCKERSLYVFHSLALAFTAKRGNGMNASF